MTLVADTVGELGLVADLAHGVVDRCRRLGCGHEARLLQLLVLLLLLLTFLVQFLDRRLIVLEVVLKVPAPTSATDTYTLVIENT